MKDNDPQGRAGVGNRAGQIKRGVPEKLLRFAWVPIPVIITLLAAGWVLDLPPIEVPPLLRPVLDFLFITAISLWVAFLAARSFLQNASVSILLFGCGMLLFGSSRFLASSAYHHFGQLNLGVTIYAIGLCVAGAVHLLIGALVSSSSDAVARRPRLMLAGAYGGTLFIVAAYTVLAFAEVTPVFFLEGAGPTPIRRNVLVLAVILLALASALIVHVAHRRPWPFGLWYGLALALLATGVFAVSFAPRIAGPAEWIGRVAQYIGGIYFLAAALTARRDRRQWDTLAYSALRESRERFRALAEATSEGIVISRDGVIADANEQFARMLGHEVEELIGTALAEYLAPGASPLLQEEQRPGLARPVEYTMICKDGSEILVEVHKHVLPGQDVQFLAMRDITTRKQQDQALRESETKLRQLFDNMSEGFTVGEILYDEDGIVCDLLLTMVNKAFEEQTGITRDVVGKPLREIFPQLERRWIETSARVALTGQPVRFDQFSRDTNRHFEVVSFRPAQGQFAALFNDVTEQKETEKILRESGEANRRNLAQLNAIVNRMTEGLAIFDPRGKLLEMNPAALMIHGFDGQGRGRGPSDRLDMLFDLFDPESFPLPPDQSPVARALRGESFSAYLVRVQRRDNGKVWIGSYGGAPVFDEGGNLILALVTMRDVTEQKEAEKALKQSRDQLEQRVRERTAELQQRADQLARLASELTLAEDRERRRLAEFLHDNLQQLLVGTKFGLHRLARELPVEQRKNLEEVENLLNESISASRTLTMELSPPILHEAGLEAGLEWLVRWMKKTHDLTVDLVMEDEVEVDRGDLRLLVFQAVRELLFNVTKHARTTSATVTVSRHDDRSLQVVVEDQGIGFDAAAILNNPNQTRDAFGLFSIRERIDLLGGRLEVASAPGQGSRFTLVAPFAFTGAHVPEEKAADDALRAGPAPEKPLLFRPGKIRLLLADDHAVVRQGISMLLASEEDVEIVGEAADGAMAVELARTMRPDIVLMDSSMPRMDGVEATRIIHHELPHTRIIGLSMYEEADRAKAMLDAGAAAYLSKTGKSEALIGTIRRLAEESLAPRVSPAYLRSERNRSSTHAH